MKRVKVTPDRHIGGKEPCFIIAEAGSNHNRDKSLAKDIISSAAEAGADAVKFQLFEGNKHYSRRTPRFKLYKKNIVDLLDEIALPRDWVGELKEHAGKEGITFFSSVTHPQDVDLLEKEGIGLYKLASFELVDLDLIRYTARTGKPVILSTGMADMREIREAVNACNAEGNKRIALLHCISSYPAPYEEVNLRAMATLESKFNAVIGFSDHTEGTHISEAAVAMGAKIIEKHYTLSRKLKGPDHPFAIEPVELTEMVRHIRNIEQALGERGKKGPSACESEFYEKARRSVHAAVDIARGSVISKDMIVVKRPGYGIKPNAKKKLLGKKAVRGIKNDEWITWEMVD